jgi:cyclin-dependent kinase
MDSSLSHFIIRHVRSRKQVPLSAIKSIFLQVVLGLDHLHENGIMHRDLKSGNILIDEDTLRIKIADLGLSRHFNLPFEVYSTNISTFI